MGGENLDAQVTPIAEFLLIVIVMMIVAAVASYVVMKIAQRRKEKAHGRLSASRRDKESGINLFGSGADPADPAEQRRSRLRTSASKGSTFNLFTFSKQLAYRLEAPSSRGRGKRRRRRSSSNDDNLRIDILKKPVPAPDAQEQPPTP